MIIRKIREYNLRAFLNLYLLRNYYIPIKYKHFRYHLWPDFIKHIKRYLLHDDVDEDDCIEICTPPSDDDYDQFEQYRNDHFKILPKDKDNTFIEKLDYYMSSRDITSKLLSEKCNIDEAGLAEIIENKVSQQDKLDKYNKKVMRYPSKITAFSLCIGLQLSSGEAQRLLSYADYTFDRSYLYDNIILFCIKHGIYDLATVKTLLKHHKQGQLLASISIDHSALE